jgi:4-alpha-glucanotransferase
MDARVDGVAVTPRTGALPEINALWFQARCLQWLWRPAQAGGAADDGGSVRVNIERLGQVMLGSDVAEHERPNRVFLHSLPLAPSFVVQDAAALSRDLQQLQSRFLTPVGLRTLDPSSAAYRPRCVGTQRERDLSYHQGPVWGWLRGHFDMAKARASSARAAKTSEKEVQFHMPIDRHWPELFDAEEPFTPRGTPAQAWSVACIDESRARRELKVDQKITEILAERWSPRPLRRRRGTKLGKRIGRSS